MAENITQPEPAAVLPAASEPAAATEHGAVPRPSGGAPRRGNGSRILNIVLGIAIALAIGGIGFATGRLTAPAAAVANGFPPGGGQGFNGNGGQGRPGGLFSGGATVQGTVESVTATTMTIKTASGETIQIALDGATTYHAQTDATSSDVATGGKVLVRLNLGSFGGGPNGNGGTGNGGAGSSLTAGDVTVVP